MAVSTDGPEPFWQAPAALAWGEGLAALWDRCHLASSVLVPLCVQTWPRADLALPWATPWAFIPARLLAKLSGVHHGGIARARAALEGLQLTEYIRAPGRAGRARVLYRLNALHLFPARRNGRAVEPYAEIPRRLVSSGLWSSLQTPAERHVLLLLALLDPIGAPDAYGADAANHDATPADWVAERRFRSGRPLGDLAALAGLRRSTMQRAIDELLCRGFLKRGPADARTHWYQAVLAPPPNVPKSGPLRTEIQAIAGSPNGRPGTEIRAFTNR